MQIDPAKPHPTRSGETWPWRRWHDGSAVTLLLSMTAIGRPERLADLDVPWWTFPAIREIDRFLRTRNGGAVAFEYGSGASTAWLARRCARVWSAEHDSRYLEITRRLLNGDPRADLLHAPPRRLAEGETAWAGSRTGRYRGWDFADYVAAIRRPGTTFDLIVIDGRARVACLREALNWVRDDGLIVLDNSNRDEYAAALAELLVPPLRLRGLAPCLPYGSETAIIRPCRDRAEAG